MEFKSDIHWGVKKTSKHFVAVKLFRTSFYSCEDSKHNLNHLSHPINSVSEFSKQERSNLFKFQQNVWQQTWAIFRLMNAGSAAPSGPLLRQTFTLLIYDANSECRNENYSEAESLPVEGRYKKDQFTLKMRQTKSKENWMIHSGKSAFRK